jgi:PleD family two-component response regulator
VVSLVIEEFRSYDLMLRFGGDEFVCSFSGDGLDEIGKRFERVNVQLNGAIPGASISVGVSQRRPQDTIQMLLDRADAAMIATRRGDCRRVDEMDITGRASIPGEAKQLNHITE